MKYIKLLLIFIVLVVGIFVILNWSQLFPTPPSQQEEGWVEVDKLNISEECQKIRDAWAKEEGWNEELYKKQRDDIEQSKAMKLFTLKGYDAVDRCLHETATNKACDGYMAELHKTPFDESELNKQYNGVQMVKKSEHLGNDPRSQKVEQIHQVYTAAKNFLNGKQDITPRYDARTNSWVSFSDQQSKIINGAKAVYNNPLFSEVSHIPGFKDGLDPNKLKSKTDGQKASFYQNLCNQIITHFKKAPATTDNYNKMDVAVKKFASQYKDKTLVKKLVSVQYDLGFKCVKK